MEKKENVAEENKQLSFWDWSPEDCPNQDAGGCGPDFDFSKHMNPPEEETQPSEALNDLDYGKE